MKKIYFLIIHHHFYKGEIIIIKTDKWRMSFIYKIPGSCSTDLLFSEINGRFPLQVSACYAVVIGEGAHLII